MVELIFSIHLLVLVATDWWCFSTDSLCLLEQRVEVTELLCQLKLIHFHTRFSVGEGRGAAAIVNSSPCSAPRWDQARSEMPPNSCSTSGPSRIRLPNLSWGILVTWDRSIRRSGSKSGLHELHRCAFDREVSHRVARCVLQKHRPFYQ